MNREDYRRTCSHPMDALSRRRICGHVHCVLCIPTFIDCTSCRKSYNTTRWCYLHPDDYQTPLGCTHPACAHTTNAPPNILAQEEVPNTCADGSVQSFVECLTKIFSSLDTIKKQTDMTDLAQKIADLDTLISARLGSIEQRLSGNTLNPAETVPQPSAVDSDVPRPEVPPAGTVHPTVDAIVHAEVELEQQQQQEQQ